MATTPAMESSTKQVRFQQGSDRPGEQPAGHTNGTGVWPQAPPQGSNPTQQSSNSMKVRERVPYQGQKLRRHEYVDEQGYVAKKRKSGTRKLAEHVAAHVAVCLCCAWLCTAPCCCGL